MLVPSRLPAPSCSRPIQPKNSSPLLAVLLPQRRHACEVLACAGATSFWVAGPTGPISTTPHRPLTGALPLGHVFVEATVYDEGA